VNRKAFLAATAAVAALPAVAPAAQLVAPAQLVATAKEPLYLSITAYDVGMYGRTVWDIAGKSKDEIAKIIEACQGPKVRGWLSSLRVRMYGKPGTILLELPSDVTVIDAYAKNYAETNARWKAYCPEGIDADDIRIRVRTDIDGENGWPVELQDPRDFRRYEETANYGDMHLFPAKTYPTE
jgi:hypothetical protein